MDARAEAQVFEQFRELAHERMVILISHRFSTVRRADQILVIHGGEILERYRLSRRAFDGDEYDALPTDAAGLLIGMGDEELLRMIGLDEDAAVDD
jgi:ABC-type transport system involved in cytochrome bd biosynthesis fused ATPase/permease subunit